MPGVTRLAPLLSFVLACGARTGLPVDDDRSAPDAGASVSPCAPTTPERFSELVGRVWDADAGGVLVSVTGPGQEVARVDPDTGRVERVGEGGIGMWSLVARDGEVWWTTSGSSDFAGRLLHAGRGGRVRALVDGLFQPGGVQHDGDAVYFAEWTNSGSLRDERRGRVLRVAPDGGAVRELAVELGLPRDTALDGDHVYWVDGRRDHVARVGRDGGAIEVVLERTALGGEIAARGGAVFVSRRLSSAGSELLRLDARTLDAAPLAAIGREVRGIEAIREGLLLVLWDGRGGGSSVGLLPDGGREVRVLDPDGGSVAVDPTHVYWSRGGDDPGLVRLCRSAL